MTLARMDDLRNAGGTSAADRANHQRGTDEQH